jgi:serine/threonine-protein kinase
MAEVYRAYHVSLDRYVAIKVLHAFLADDPEFKIRFENEARNIARLKHPHIIQVYDFENDPENESYFMVMELIDGPTLKDVLAAQAERGELMPLGEAIRIIREAAGALAYAHSQKMIHRDVKPANLMLDRENRVILTDFGIAKIVTGAQFTSSGGMVGTPAYMAPEQGIGDAGDERSDLYSLGVIFFQLVTGRLPYDADTPLAIILKHLNAPVPSACDFNPDVPEAVDAVLQRLLAKEPAARYQNANALIADLERVERGEALGASAPIPVAAPVAVVPPQTYDTQPLPLAVAEQPMLAVPGAPPAPPRRRIPLGLWIIFGGIIGAALFGAIQGGALTPIFGFLASPTPTPSSTPTLTATLTLTPSETPTASETPSPTPTFTFTPSATLTPTDTATLPPTATLTPRATNTVLIVPTTAPTLTPSETLTPTHTFTPSITPTPTTTLTPTLDITLTLIQATLLADFQTATINACDFNYEIVSQIPADGAPFAANQDYTRVITLRNTGSCAWERNSALMFVSGENFNAGARIILRDRVNVGDEVALTFAGHTPVAHVPLSGTWELRTPGNIRIGRPITISISVFGG